MTANTGESWNSIAKALHWAIAFLILFEVPVGFLMTYTYGPSLKDDHILKLHTFASQIHHTNGFLILTLVVFRLGWRYRHPAPEMPVSLARYEKALALLNHGFLYALLILFPLSGWCALSVFAESPLWLFGSDHIMPFILPKLPLTDTFGYGFFARIHRFCYQAGAGLLTLHIVAALWHHGIRKDNVLRRMWPLVGL